MKSPIKNTLYFLKYKKDKLLTKIHTIVLLFYYYLLSEIYLFHIFQNTTYFLTRLFLYTLLLYIFIYIVSLIIF
jgi:hypothetical protein